RFKFVCKLFACIAISIVWAYGTAAQTKNSCLECHAQFDAPLGVNSKDYLGGIHAQKGITCTSCHGGDASSDDMTISMGKKAGFRGHIERTQIPSLCGKCHSDAAYMRGYDPSLRTDQLSQYATSIHGKLIAKGDANAAVCTDCHGLHNIVSPKDPRSSVYPTNVAQTCSQCHANAEHMKPYKIPVTQFADYQHSVHHAALANGDLSAPTCSTCHGSHGAAPPGLDSVQHVCATCHLFQSQLFDSGPHKAAFEAMSLPGCITCHSNHGILKPTDSLIGTGEQAVCVKCHSSGDPGFEASATMHKQLVDLDAAIARSDGILNRAGDAGVEVGEAKLGLNEAHDDLTKARVSIHSVKLDVIDQNIQAGMKVTEKAYQAGLDAMGEVKYRRKGLTVSLIAIGFVIIALALLIRELEGKNKSNKEMTE
ncbi:MAG TPA: cytochrome c3 family protein, partial [Candidatus Acidoferrum sp.]|nr:cytochrome c3 family protein [Candidatus Acidoferrum sp.]